MTKIMEWNDLADKSKWPDGLWNKEPDKILWVDLATDYFCMAIRHPEMGHFCGYVGLPKNHPAHGKNYDTIHDIADVSVHGGLTSCSDSAREDFAVAGDDDLWWVGFDCAHGFDFKPGFPVFLQSSSRDEVYRDLEYVKKEVTLLAAQLFLLTNTG